METMIELKDVNKTIKQQVILDHVSLRIPKGGIYGFVGRNGSGKSMLFKAICGFISVDSGSIIVDHKRIGEEIDFPMNMGVIIEKPALIPYMTGMDNLRYLASIQKKITQDRIAATMQLVGLDPLSKKKVRAYSLGMKQRLAIAQAMMEEPDILILDEPMNALDQQAASLVKDLLKQEKDRNCTILICSHIAGDLEELSDQLYRIENGAVTREW
jgi:ABC-2 type transport system ATP-binding protein